MTMELYSNRKFLGPLATTSGYGELIEIADGKPCLSFLLKTGHSERVPGIKAEVQALLATTISDSVRTTLQRLQQMLQTAGEGITIV